MESLTMQQIQCVVADYCGIPIATMRGTSQRRTITRARQIAMYLCHNALGRGPSDIGRWFQRDHTTVCHGIDRISLLAETDLRLAADLREVRLRLNL
jgi:chromosomal replication initiator protein